MVRSSFSFSGEGSLVIEEQVTSTCVENASEKTEAETSSDGDQVQNVPVSEVGELQRYKRRLNHSSVKSETVIGYSKVATKKEKLSIESEDLSGSVK